MALIWNLLAWYKTSADERRAIDELPHALVEPHLAAAGLSAG
jgi:hypothetical protein